MKTNNNLEVENEELRKVLADIYMALGTKEADCTKWAKQIAELKDENKKLKASIKAENDFKKSEERARRLYGTPTNGW